MRWSHAECYFGIFREATVPKAVINLMVFMCQICYGVLIRIDIAGYSKSIGSCRSGHSGLGELD